MKRGNLFWGFILVVTGGTLLAKSLGWLPPSLNIAGLIVPVALILVGAMVLTRNMNNGSEVSAQDLLFQLEGATRLDVEINHGAGVVRVNGATSPGVALAANRGIGLDHKVRRTPEALMIQIDAGPTFIPFLGPDSGEWLVSLSNEVPVALNIDAGAAKLDLDLTDIKLNLLKIDMGAAELKCALPANAGLSVVDVECGMASLVFNLPADVGAKVLLKQGASSVDLDPERFDKLNADPALYQTKNYNDVPNKVDLNLEGGANSIVIK